MIIKRWHAFTFILACFGVYLVLLYRDNFMPKLLELQESTLLPLNDERRNDQPSTTLPTVRRKQMEGYSMEVEMARRILCQDEQELWNFLAAQLHLHKNQNNQTVDNVIASILEYKSVLYGDVELYKSKLEDETGASATTLLRISTHVNTSLTELFNSTLYELKRIRKGKPPLASLLSDDTKSRLRSLHMDKTSYHDPRYDKPEKKVRALLQQLRSQTYQGSKSWELGNKVQKQIQRLQYPINCTSTRKLLCGYCSRLGGCGLGCIVHHIGMCLVTAYLSNRTMILDCHGWRYAERGWEAAFLPISNCTQEYVKESFNSATEFKTADDVPIVFNQIIPNTIRMNMPAQIKGSEFFPPAVPRDILNKILQFNCDPPSWWIGQFKAWALRLKDELALDVNAHFQRHNITGPVVGLHVRRTDKNREAAYHSLDEYMVHVAEWYDAYELTHPNVERKIYLATDEPAIIDQANSEYSRYEFIYDKDIISAASPERRYNEQALMGTLKDIYSLVRCDFVVCTLSSTMCRLVYELAQARHGADHRFQSLDENYFVAGERLVYERVTHAHIPIRPNEINVKQGDVVKFLRNNWDGYVNVTNPKKKQTGLIPAFKLDRIFKIYNYSSKL